MNTITLIQLAHMWQQIQALQRNEARLLVRIAEQERQLAEFNRRLSIVETKMYKTQPEFSAN